MQNFWDERYGAEGFAYGTEPNEFLAGVADRIPPGPVLCLCDGEGRNGVFLATRGHDVTSVDGSAVGLEKARRLAASRGVSIRTVHADLAQFTIEPGTWSGIVSIFAHLPPALRERVHGASVRGLKPGGVFILEAYTIEQLALKTGGPSDPQMLMSLAALRRELAGLEFLTGQELRREIAEGTFHQGLSAVVQVVGRLPR